MSNTMLEKYSKEFKSTMDRLFKTLASGKSWEYMNRLDLFNVLFEDRQKEIQSLKEQVEMLEKCVVFYSDIDKHPVLINTTTISEKHMGKTARQALEKLKTMRGEE